MIKFALEMFIKNDVVINCENEEQTEKLITILEDKIFYKNYKVQIRDGFIRYYNNVCYRIVEYNDGEFMIVYSSDFWYAENGYTIIKFSDLIFDKGVSNLKTLEQFAKSNRLSGLVAKNTIGFKGLIVKLGGKNYILRGGTTITELGDEQKLYKPKKNTGFLEDILNDNNLELVWEKEPNIDWSKVPIDTKVLCKFGDYWHKRYFAGVNNEGKPLVFYDGQNSWSAHGSELLSENVVLFEGNENLLKGGK